MLSGLERAVAFATEAHSGQVDKLGEPYIDHCLRVMDAVSGRAKRVAVLHDVVEDTEYSLGMVGWAARLSADEVLALSLLTRNYGQARTYSEYIGRLAEPPDGGFDLAAPLAREVKVADLRDDLGRWSPGVGMGLKRRYERALARLTEGETDGG
jgi:hypothetical protein